jgi:hypothetical protein
MTANVKLGKGVATSYRPVGDAALGLGTCPSNCMHLPDNGGKCYTRKFLVNNQQRNSKLRNDDFSRFLEKGAKFVRLHTSGDFFTSLNGQLALDTEYLDEVIAFAKQNPDVVFWTYCHNPKILIEAGYTYKNGSFPTNLHITASCDTDVEKYIAIDNGYRTARVITALEEKSDNETLCPYDLALHKGEKSKTNCKDCTLCFNAKHLKNIAFLKH